MKKSDQEFLDSIGIDFKLSLLNASDEALIEQIRKILINISNSIEANANHYIDLKEEGVSSIVAAIINGGLFFKAEIESNQKGHVDITVTCPSLKDSAYFKYIGEAKIWRGKRYAVEGFEQLNLYMTGRHKNAFMIFYFKQAGCDKPFLEYVTSILADKNGEKIVSENRFAVTKHIHSSTATVEIDHFAVHMPNKPH